MKLEQGKRLKKQGMSRIGMFPDPRSVVSASFFENLFPKF